MLRSPRLRGRIALGRRRLSRNRGRPNARNLLRLPVGVPLVVLIIPGLAYPRPPCLPNVRAARRRSSSLAGPSSQPPLRWDHQARLDRDCETRAPPEPYRASPGGKWSRWSRNASRTLNGAMAPMGVVAVVVVILRLWECLDWAFALSAAWEPVAAASVA